MPWVKVKKQNYAEEEYENSGFSLIKWIEKGNPNFWVLYKTKSSWTRADRLFTILRETPTERAKEMAMEWILNNLSNKELREMLGG